MPKYNTLEELQEHFVEAASEILYDLQDEFEFTDFYRTKDGNEYNGRFQTDDGYFLILSGWDDANLLSEELLKRYPFITEETGIDVVSYDNVLAELFFQCYGFSDEYGSCDVCRSPLCFDDREFIDDYEDCERICFDCLDDDYYFSWLENNAERANQKYTHKELEERGWKCVEYDLKSTMHNMPSDSPEDILAKALENDPDGSYIFSITHADPFTVDFELFRRS